MAKFSYLNHLYEVAAVAEETPCGWGEAWDRFRADVANGKATDNTGTACEFFNFALAGEQWNSMTADEQQAARDEWYAFMQTETGAYKRDLVIALCESYRKWRDNTWMH